MKTYYINSIGCDKDNITILNLFHREMHKIRYILHTYYTYITLRKE